MSPRKRKRYLFDENVPLTKYAVTKLNKHVKGQKLEHDQSEQDSRITQLGIINVDDGCNTEHWMYQIKIMAHQNNKYLLTFKYAKADAE
ncbi:hypothetical protein TSAR_016899 [Trichomalopsis sarcophagae]|uniref:Uncharacterized protein n=1 Tax=Trichomalopsis sarcophagae TaxID=543379 RepID=A0A232EE11_9HYME|nr:hypothetical protein TSAR_016899 [Trichomalopsis sarcophagae]